MARIKKVYSPEDIKAAFDEMERAMDMWNAAGLIDGEKDHAQTLAAMLRGLRCAIYATAADWPAAAQIINREEKRRGIWPSEGI